MKQHNRLIYYAVGGMKTAQWQSVTKNKEHCDMLTVLLSEIMMQYGVFSEHHMMKNTTRSAVLVIIR